MKMFEWKRNLILRAAMRALVLTLVATLASPAYERPLSSESIREAYFFGRRRDEKLAAFLTQYVKRLPPPKTGPYVAEVEVRTPYQQAVSRARVAPEGYSAQQAEADYRSRRELVFVRVRINVPPAYIPATGTGGDLRPSEFWRDFSIQLVQAERALEPTKVNGRSLYSRRSLIGAEVDLEFDAAQVDSAPARVQVSTPDGQHVTVEFELEKIR